MHTTDLGTANVPAFLTKLWKLVEDKDYDDLICWNPNGRSFIIKNQSRFSKELLPLYFKHNNMASFIRQLNMYGFRKLTSIENSGLKTEKDEMEFYHQYFLKDQESLLEFIKRKGSLQVSSATPKGNGSSSGSAVMDPTKLGSEDVNDIIADMKAIRERQDSADTALMTVQRENEALWREIAVLRQKHQKQQQIVDKLIHFLVTLVSNRSSFIKRKAPLMIEGLLDDGPNGSNKRQRVVGGVGGSSSGIAAGGGPVIHDVTDDILEDELEAAANSSPIITNVATAGDASPAHNLDDGSNQGLISSASPLNFSEPTEPLDTLLDPLETLVAESGIGAADIAAPASDMQLIEQPVTVATQALQPQQQLLLPQVTVTDVTPLVAVPSQVLPQAVSTRGLDVVNAQANDNDGQQDMFRDFFSNHLEGIDTELTWLQEQLQSGGLNIDNMLGAALGSPGSKAPAATSAEAKGSTMSELAELNDIDLTGQATGSETAWDQFLKS